MYLLRQDKAKKNQFSSVTNLNNAFDIHKEVTIQILVEFPDHYIQNAMHPTQKTKNVYNMQIEKVDR